METQDGEPPTLWARLRASKAGRSTALAGLARPRAVVLFVALAATVLAPQALAGYPVQPYDGSTVATKTPTFLVYKDPNELFAEVDVSTSPNTSGYGFTSGYVGSCRPNIAFGEANKFTCQLSYPIEEGTYYWRFSFERYECRDVTYGSFTYRSCDYYTFNGPVWSFSVALPQKPTEQALTSIAGPTTRSHVNPTYSQIASAISKKTATVNCWSRADWNALHVEWTKYEGARGGDTTGLGNTLGYVRPDIATVINLSPDICSRLDLLFYKRKRPSTPRTKFDIARAVVALAHEAIHVYGVEDEADTECYAIQFVPFTGRSLGLTAGYARDLANLLWTKDWPTWEGTEYWTPECYDGGPLDLYPSSSVWP